MSEFLSLFFVMICTLNRQCITMTLYGKSNPNLQRDSKGAILQILFFLDSPLYFGTVPCVFYKVVLPIPNPLLYKL